METMIAKLAARASGPAGPEDGSGRVEWVDCARGWCIVLVVMMHSALGVGLIVGDAGWLHSVVAFAKPFRMPDFFLVAGLFAGRALEAPWRRFLDRKVLHFSYFYMLWLLVSLAAKAQIRGITDPGSFAAEYTWRLIQPFSTTWFIQLLPILYLASRVVRRVPTPAILAVGLVLHFVAATRMKPGGYAMESELTEWITADGFLLFWIYFIFGVRFRSAVFRLARSAAACPAAASTVLISWALFEAVAVAELWPEAYGFDIAFGLLGALAVVVAAALASQFGPMRWLSYLGRRSLFIYLAFFLPMAAARFLLLRLVPNLDVGTASLIVTAAAVAGPLVIEKVLRETPLSFLFERPGWARLCDRIEGEGHKERHAAGFVST